MRREKHLIMCLRIAQTIRKPCVPLRPLRCKYFDLSLMAKNSYLVFSCFKIFNKT